MFSDYYRDELFPQVETDRSIPEIVKSSRKAIRGFMPTMTSRKKTIPATGKWKFGRYRRLFHMHIGRYYRYRQGLTVRANSYAEVIADVIKPELIFYWESRYKRLYLLNAQHPSLKALTETKPLHYCSSQITMETPFSHFFI